MGGIFQNRMSDPDGIYERNLRATFALSTMWEHREKMTIYKPGSVSCHATESSGSLVLDCPVSTQRQVSPLVTLALRWTESLSLSVSPPLFSLVPQVTHRIPHTPAQMGSIPACLAFSLSLLQMIDFSLFKSNLLVNSTYWGGGKTQHKPVKSNSIRLAAGTFREEH